MNQPLSRTWAALALSAVVLLSACGGGGSSAPPATAAVASSNAGIAAVSGQIETAASFALDGVDAGFYGLPKPAMAAPAAFEMPSAALPAHPVPTCATGTVTSVSTGIDQSNIVYNNCVIDGAKLNGTITVAGPVTYQTNGVWTATFAGFSVQAPGVDGKTVKFNYSGTEGFSNMTWSGSGASATATGGKVKLNVQINVDNGSSQISLSNFTVDFTDNGTTTTLSMSGQFGYDLKLADFGVPATPGLPPTIAVVFDVTTPSTLSFTATTDSGVYRMSSPLYTIEIDYTNDVGKFTAGGVTQTFPLGA
jgi:hypothetical protein